MWMLFGVLPKAKRHEPRDSLLSSREIWLDAPLNHTSQSPLRLGGPCDSILANQDWAMGQGNDLTCGSMP